MKSSPSPVGVPIDPTTKYTLFAFPPIAVFSARYTQQHISLDGWGEAEVRDMMGSRTTEVVRGVEKGDGTHRPDLRVRSELEGHLFAQRVNEN